jgi:spermidine synthase
MSQNRQISMPFWVLSIFFMSFCSLCFQILIATKLSHLLDEGLFIYPASLGVFLLFMGLGSFTCSDEKERDGQQLLYSLVKIELLLFIIGSLSILTISYQSVFPLFENWPILGGLFFSGLIGYFSGQELPLVLHAYEEFGGKADGARELIFYDYFASLFASITLVLLLIPSYGTLKTSSIIALVNLGICLALYLKLKNKKPLIKILLTVGLILTATLWTQYQKIETDLLERYASLQQGHRFNFKLMATKRTFYQEVTTYIARVDGEEVKDHETEAEILKHPSDYYLAAYLDGNLQFMNLLGVKSDAYHRYLVEAVVKIQKPKKVLILGGGDGLPARELLQYPEIDSITMVDLDPEWVNFTKNNPLMAYNSNNGLKNPKLKLEFSDAFKWVIATDQKFDVVLIDFPGTNNLADLRIGTIQFGNDLKRILTKKGVIVFQDDTLRDEDDLPDLFQTAKLLKVSLLFGTKLDTNLVGDPVSQFLAFKDQGNRDSFLKTYNSTLKKTWTMNMDFIIPRIFPLGRKPRAISFYDPHILRQSFEDWLEGIFR